MSPSSPQCGPPRSLRRDFQLSRLQLLFAGLESGLGVAMQHVKRPAVDGNIVERVRVAVSMCNLAAGACACEFALGACCRWRREPLYQLLEVRLLHVLRESRPCGIELVLRRVPRVGDDEVVWNPYSSIA